MLQKEAQILIHDANDLNRVCIALTEAGFEVKLLHDMVDPCSSAKFIEVAIATELSADQFWNWTESLIRPHGGEVLEASAD